MNRPKALSSVSVVVISFLLAASADHSFGQAAAGVGNISGVVRDSSGAMIPGASVTIANEAKGVLWLKVSCKGKTAHGAYPWRGENAIAKMHRFLGDLCKEFPVPKQAQPGHTFGRDAARIHQGRISKDRSRKPNHRRRRFRVRR